MIPKLGEVMTDNKKGSNDWKTRMLKAGLQDKGLIMPEEKETRLNGVIGVLDD